MVVTLDARKHLCVKNETTLPPFSERCTKKQCMIKLDDVSTKTSNVASPSWLVADLGVLSNLNDSSYTVLVTV